MDNFYEKYINIQKFITIYRKYKLDDKFLDLTEFKKVMQFDQYIKHKCTDVANGKIVYIYIFHEQCKYIKTTPLFKRLMDKIPNEPADIIIISKLELSIYINKSILKYKSLTYYNYLHKYFALELSKGPMCSEHEILSNTYVRNLCANELIIHPLSLPSISINDPQNIWIGGTLGQVIKITSISELSGKVIRYRIVSPDSGKMLNIQKLSNQIQSNDDAQNQKDINDTKNKDIIEKDVDDIIDEYVDDIIESDEDD